MDPFKERIDFLAALRGLAGRAKEQEARPSYNEAPIRCKRCGTESTRGRLADTLFVCPECGHHFRLPARLRIRMTVDPTTFREFGGSIGADDPLDFPGYSEKIEAARDKSHMKEAVITGTGKIDGHKAVLAVMDNRFMMGSMGTAVGEKITRAAEYATKKKLPLVIFSTSGGARMQEGILSLMQMAKTSAAIGKHAEAGQLFISVLTDPTTGGVTASFASLGDIVLAEPNALIGFAGPRVIEQTIRQELPKGFQRAEFQMEHGFVDQIVHRSEMKKTLGRLLALHDRKQEKKGKRWN